MPERQYELCVWPGQLAEGAGDKAHGWCCAGKTFREAEISAPQGSVVTVRKDKGRKEMGLRSFSPKKLLKLFINAT